MIEDPEPWRWLDTRELQSELEAVARAYRHEAERLEAQTRLANRAAMFATGWVVALLYWVFG